MKKSGVGEKMLNSELRMLNFKLRIKNEE